MSFVFSRNCVKTLTYDGKLGHHSPIKFRFFSSKRGKMSYIGHLKLDDIPATAETWHLTGHVLKVN
jgi:hypothetical protein